MATAEAPFDGYKILEELAAEKNTRPSRVSRIWGGACETAKDLPWALGDLRSVEGILTGLYLFVGVVALGGIGYGAITAIKDIPVKKIIAAFTPQEAPRFPPKMEIWVSDPTPTKILAKPTPLIRITPTSVPSKAPI